MDLETSFRYIQELIKLEKYERVKPQIDSIIESHSDDVFIMIKCASILKVIDDEESCQSIIDRVIGNIPEDPETRYSIALSLRNLGRKSESYELVLPFKNDVSKANEIARTMLMADEVEEALSVINFIPNPESKDLILKCEILCALDETNDALAIAKELNDKEQTPDSLVNLCTVLMYRGEVKEAVRIGREQVKSDKKSADSNALEAYIMWINGKISAAANFANRALTIDYSNERALEVMAMCLIEKKKYNQAKMLAGVINEKNPLNPAVLRILDACRIASKS